MSLIPKQQPPYYKQNNGNIFTLTDAEIKTIPTTGYQILPPGGTNKLYTINKCILTIRKTAVYGNTTDATWYLTTNGDIWGYYTCLAQTQSFLTDTGDMIHIMQTPYTEDVDGFTQTNNTQTIPRWTNQPVILRDYNIATNYTGGNAANSLTINITYTITTI